MLIVIILYEYYMVFESGDIVKVRYTEQLIKIMPSLIESEGIFVFHYYWNTSSALLQAYDSTGKPSYGFIVNLRHVHKATKAEIALYGGSGIIKYISGS